MEINALNVLIAEDHPITRKGLTILLKETFKNIVINEAVSIRQLQEKLKKLPKIDLVLLDLYFDNEPVLPYIQNIRSMYPNLKILVVTAADVNVLAVRILELGIKGIINKAAGPEELSKAMQRVLNGEFAIPDSILENLITQSSNVNLKLNKVELKSLTKREMEIMTFILKGFKIKDIAENLNISRSVVSIHKTNLFKKLRIKTIQDLIQWAHSQKFPVQI